MGETFNFERTFLLKEKRSPDERERSGGGKKCLSMCVNEAGLRAQAGTCVITPPPPALALRERRGFSGG